MCISYESARIGLPISFVWENIKWKWKIICLIYLYIYMYFIRTHLWPDLISTLAGLQMHNFPHVELVFYMVPSFYLLGRCTISTRYKLTKLHNILIKKKTKNCWTQILCRRFGKMKYIIWREWFLLYVWDFFFDGVVKDRWQLRAPVVFTSAELVIKKRNKSHSTNEITLLLRFFLTRTTNRKILSQIWTFFFLLSL